MENLLFLGVPILSTLQNLASVTYQKNSNHTFQTLEGMVEDSLKSC